MSAGGINREKVGIGIGRFVDYVGFGDGGSAGAHPAIQTERGKRGVLSISLSSSDESFFPAG